MTKLKHTYYILYFCTLTSLHSLAYQTGTFPILICGNVDK